MPSKKDKISNLDLRRLIWTHGIRFKGPVPPKEWPEEHENQFRNIREINFIRYDAYMTNKTLPKGQRDVLRKKVRHLRQKADELLGDGGTTENTWRELEQIIFARFDENIICENCNDELWIPDYKYEATARNVEEQEILDRKRKERNLCCCEQKQSLSRTKNSDGEHCKIFAHELDKLVSHVPGDKLQNYSIPRKPDRVVGLHAPLSISPDDAYFPVTGKRILLPFLVVEAKKEGYAPGFRAVQCQTAFPIRRFLKAQDALWSHNRPLEPSLVWFFAFQGEEWRVHACTYTDDKVRIYDLWLGTIQSQDGALQLLLIVDFVWSWARDIYRPTVRKLLSDTLPNFRDPSPASIARFRPSLSLSSVSSPPVRQSQDYTQSEILENCLQKEREGDGVAGQEILAIREQQKPVILDASSHEFLRWAVGHQLAPCWTKLGSIRHSSIVHFELSILIVSTPEVFGMDTPVDLDDRLILENLLSSTFILLPDQLHDLLNLWTGNIRPTPVLNLGSSSLQVTFCFQTYCDRSSWQIKRVLTCLTWKTKFGHPHVETESLPVYLDDSSRLHQVRMKNLKNALVDVQQLQGRDSVLYALGDVGMILKAHSRSHDLGWTECDDAKMPKQASESLTNATSFMDIGKFRINCIDIQSGLFQIDQDYVRRLPSTVPPLGQDSENMASMICYRSSSWPENCPRFCLFVLLQEYPRIKSDICKLLNEAITLKNFFSERDCPWSSSDWKRFASWRQTLGDKV